MYGSRNHSTAYGHLFSVCEGWTGDDLAEIHRIHIALNALSTVFEFGCGVTDEGDPWFVFCQPNGEIIVHIAIIDRVYHLVAPAISASFSAGSLPEVTCQLLRAMAKRRPH